MKARSLSGDLEASCLNTTPLSLQPVKVYNQKPGSPSISLVIYHRTCKSNADNAIIRSIIPTHPKPSRPCIFHVVQIRCQTSRRPICVSARRGAVRLTGKHFIHSEEGALQASDVGLAGGHSRWGMVWSLGRGGLEIALSSRGRSAGGVVGATAHVGAGAVIAVGVVGVFASVRGSVAIAAIAPCNGVRTRKQ